MAGKGRPARRAHMLPRLAMRGAQLIVGALNPGHAAHLHQ